MDIRFDRINHSSGPAIIGYATIGGVELYSAVLLNKDGSGEEGCRREITDCMVADQALYEADPDAFAAKHKVG